MASKPDLSIDRHSASQRNTFTSVRLDRLVEKRDDPDWVAGTLASSEARLVPQWRGKSLLDPGRPEEPVLYPLPGEVDTGDRPPTLLGRDRRHVYFAAAVDDRQRDELLQHHPGAVFSDLRLASTGLHEKHAGILAYAKALLYWQYRNARRIDRAPRNRPHYRRPHCGISRKQRQLPYH